MRAIAVLTLAALVVTTLGCGGDKENGPTGQQNQPPDAPSSPFPADGAVEQLSAVTLSWQCSDPDGDPIRFEVYFGSGGQPSLVARDVGPPFIERENLALGTSFDWYVVARDTNGHSTQGPTWTFMTSAVQPSGLYLVGSSTTQTAFGVAVSGNNAYFSSGSTCNLNVMDVSDPTNPTIVGTNNGSCGHGRHVQVVDSYVYFFALPTSLRIFNVSTPSNPVLVGTYGSAGGISAAYVSEGYAYLSVGIGMLEIADVSDPSSPTRVSFTGIGASGEAMAVFPDTTPT